MRQYLNFLEHPKQNKSLDLTFTATRYSAPFTPNVGPLDPATSKDAIPLYQVYRSIRPSMGFDYSKS